MKPIVIFLAVVAIVSFGYGFYRHNEASALNAELEEVRSRALAAEAEAKRQGAIAQEQKLAVEKIVEETRMAMEMAQKRLVECEKRRK
jgi:hypothetical protein